MVETRARARQHASHSEAKVVTATVIETPQLDALVRELGAEEARQKTLSRGPRQKLEEWYSLLLLRCGATLLTPCERTLYGLSIGVIVVLVSMGVSHAAAFYARVLSQSVLGPS